MKSSSSPIAWAVFLACSWTWCIGMFLPVLMVRDWGVWGWVIFAIPNVIGAAAMGWVLHRPNASEEIIRSHTVACKAFSVITILFHVYFTGWIISRLLGLPLAMATFGVALFFWILGQFKPRRDLPVACLVLLFSLAAFAAFWARNGTLPWRAIYISPAVGLRGVVWLLPVSILGFALCPYLDLTFHRARQSTSQDGAKIAFSLGFGLFFLLMIVFTLWYAPWLNRVLAGQAPGVIRWIVGFHMLVQAAFTIAIHTRSAFPNSRAVAYIGMPAALLIATATAWLTGLDSVGRLGEVIYLSFMVFYALIFPAYIWLCMIPGTDRTSSPTPARVRMLVIVVVLASPMYWMGFIQRQTAWLLPAVALVVISRWLVPAKAAGG